MSNFPRLLISTTVPETLATILVGQPRYLNQYFDVSLVTSPGDLLDEVMAGEGVPVHKVRMVRGINPIQDIRSIWAMIRIIRCVRPQLIHSYTPKAGLVTMIAAWICGVPVRIHTFTGLIFPTSMGLKGWVLKIVDRLISACASEVVPEGEGVRRDLERFNITKKNMNVIGHGNVAGVDTSFFCREADGVSEAGDLLKKSLGIPSGDGVFCFVGRLNKDKGIVELVEAFKKIDSAWHLVIVGGLDESAPISSEVFDEINDNERIHLTGFVRDVRPVMAMSDFLVLPSYREGFPNVILQAGAMKLPVIATDISGCNEVVENDFNGVLVSVKSVDSLADAMKALIKVPVSERRRMGERARNRIKQRFERDDHWRRMVSFYKDRI